KDAAGRYIQTLDTEVKRISGMAGVSVDGATIAATSRKLGGLKQQGEQFGTTFTSPLDKCRSAGIYARMYWDVMAGFITTETPAKALATYRENARWCREQIATQPKPTVTIKAAAGKPPFQGCLRVLSLDEQPGQAVSWSCPKANVKL
ncbi:MAG: hypothetical protein HYZ18_00725, partial [Pseudogulbenkiania sp.]|nr:hypothetical protein [Pseudogulbenkiania sp.]